MVAILLNPLVAHADCSYLLQATKSPTPTFLTPEEHPIECPGIC